MLNAAAWLITQRSQVQILPRYQVSAGQRSDRQEAVRPFDLHGSVAAARLGRISRARLHVIGRHRRHCTSSAGRIERALQVGVGMLPVIFLSRDLWLRLSGVGQAAAMSRLPR